MTDNPEILKIVLKRKLLQILSDDFQISVQGILRNLSEFKSEQEVRIVDSFKNFDGDFDKADKECMSKFGEMLHLEKTVGNSAAKAAIIVVSSFIKSAAQISDLTEEKLFGVGPTIENDLNWAESVEIASNYIRHLVEWQIPSKDLLKRGEDLIWKNVKNLVGKLPTPKARRNADFLKRLGFKSDQIIGTGTDVSYQLSLKLELDNFEKTSTHFRDWCNALM